MLEEKSLLINLSTLTPMWTGGATGKVDRLHITSLIGSLRWWYEVLVRGVGGKVCDKHSCIYDKNKPNDGLCDACKIFGTTGYARQFKMDINDEKSLKVERTKPPIIEISRTISGKPNISTWYFKDRNNKDHSHLRGDLSIRIVATNRQFNSQLIGGLIQFIADWASIGARPQMGFGVVEVTPRQNTQYLFEHLQTVSEAKTYNTLPSLRNMFFARVETKTNDAEEAFELKYDLRNLIRTKFPQDTELRHFLMGTVKGERQGAKIMMSRPYANNIMRIWGWVPEVFVISQGRRENKIPQDKILRHIQSHLENNYFLDDWRAFKTQSVQESYDTPLMFLHSLLGDKANA